METKSKKHSVINNLIYVFGPVAKNKPIYLVWIALEAVLFAILPLMASGISAIVISLVGKELSLVSVAVAILGVFAVYGGVNGVHSWITNVNNMSYINIRLAYHYSSLAQKDVAVSLEQFESDEVRKMGSLAREALGTNHAGLEGSMRHFESLLANLLGLLMYCMIVGGLNWKIMLLILVLCGVSTFISDRATKVYDRVKGKLARYGRMESYVNRTVDNVAGGKDIRIFGLSDWLIGKYDRAIRARRKLFFSYDVARFGADMVEILLNAARNLICYLYLISMIKNGMAVSMFAFYLGLVGGFAAWFTQISRMLVEMKKDSGMIDDYRAYLELENGIQDEGRIPENGFSNLEIVFEHVSYQYEGGTAPVLKDVSFTIKPGEHVALVGLNGAGKSTLVKLMAGLYLPCSGAIYINGVDTRSLNRMEFMRHCSAIFQNPFLLSYPVGENVALDEKYDAKKVWDCLETADIKRRVEALPKGIDTWMGKDIAEDGVSLSGGENQRLLLARALYRDPGLLLLDEPTAALDAIAENEIYETYNQTLKGITSLFISHRLASTRFCDRILLMGGGEIREQGTHEDLMAKNGAYAELFEIQSKYYREEK